MPRPLRSQFPYGYYHVYARGVDGRRLFEDADDHDAYARFLSDAAGRHGWRVHCAVQMPDHIHLILEVGQPGLSRGVQLLHGRHAQRYNLRHGRVGHLFQTRFGAKAIRDDRQLRRTISTCSGTPFERASCAIRATGRGCGRTTRSRRRPGPLHDRAVEILERE